MLYPNGILVQDTSFEMVCSTFDEVLSSNGRKYDGLSRYIDDPLCRIHDHISQSLSKKFYEGEYSVYIDCYRDGEVNPLWVITCIEQYNEYIERCEELNIHTRTFFIESTYRYPLWRGELPELEQIGYEVVSIDLSDTSFYEVLHTPKYLHYAEKLNEHGLFGDFETAKAFYNCVSEKEADLIQECDGIIARVSALKQNK